MRKRIKLKKNKNTEKTDKMLAFVLLKAAGVLAGVIVLFSFIFGIFFCNGETMYPRLRDGDIAIYYRLVGTYQVGDVVVYENTGEPAVARIAARQGDTVEINGEGQLIVNGNIQQEEIFFPTEPIAGGIAYPYDVKEGEFFLLCDYRPNSSDSRFFGGVSKEDIRGKVINLFRRRGI